MEFLEGLESLWVQRKLYVALECLTKQGLITAIDYNTDLFTLADLEAAMRDGKVVTERPDQVRHICEMELWAERRQIDIGTAYIRSLRENKTR